MAASEHFLLPSYGSGGWGDVRVLKLDPSGGILYSAVLGGSAPEIPFGIALDAAGNAYVVGETESVDFPVLGALQGSLSGGRDAFVVKIAPSGALIASTYLGGSSGDSGRSIAVDSAGSARLAPPVPTLSPSACRTTSGRKPAATAAP